MCDEKDSELVEERRLKGRTPLPARDDTAGEKAIAQWENEGGAIRGPEQSNKKKGNQRSEGKEARQSRRQALSRETPEPDLERQVELEAGRSRAEGEGHRSG